METDVSRAKTRNLTNTRKPQISKHDKDELREISDERERKINKLTPNKIFLS